MDSGDKRMNDLLTTILILLLITNAFLIIKLIINAKRDIDRLDRLDNIDNIYDDI